MTRPLLPHMKTVLDYVMEHPDNRRWGLFLEMGLAKTALACAIAGATKHLYDHIFIIVPASLMVNWKNEIEMDRYLLEGEYTIFPYSRISLNQAQTLNITSRSLVILDESHFIKNPRSNRTKFFTMKLAPDLVINSESKRGAALLQKLEVVNPAILSLTGTPSPRDITDLWIQCMLLDAWTNNQRFNYRAFEAVYCKLKQINPSPHNKVKHSFNMRLGEQNRDILMKGFEGKAFFIKKEDVLDLPPKIYQVIHYQPTAEQKRYIKEMKKEGLTQVDITNAYVMSHMHNMNAVCSGFAVTKFDEDGRRAKEIVEFKNNPKLDILKDILVSMDEKQLIIFCSYHKEMEMISSFLDSKKYSYAKRSGLYAREFNQQSIDHFVEGKVQILLATTASTKVGLTMVNCDTVIYFSNTRDWEVRSQSEDRIHRIGQTNKCLYIDIVAKGFPDMIALEDLKNKKEINDSPFKYFKEFLNRIEI